MAEPFLIHPYFLEFVLPFVLVFTLIFAVLQKSQLLGEGKKQIDAMIGLVVGLILIAFPGPRDIIVLLMPFLAVSVVILLVFMLLYGFIVGTKDGNVLAKGWQYTFIAILALALVTFLLIISGYWDSVHYYFFGSNYRQIWANIILVVAVVGAIVAVVLGGGTTSSSN